MHWLTATFLCFLAASTFCRWWLNRRQVAAIIAHRSRVPAAFEQHIELTAHHKAADYTMAHARVSRWELLLDAMVLLGLTLGGGIEALDRWVQYAALPAPWHGTAVVLATLLVTSLLSTPFSIWRTFGIEQRFGFNRMTAALYLTDLAKSLLLTLIIGAPLLAAVLFLMQRAGTAWWLYAWLLLTAFSAAASWAYPVLIAPLFNKFTPLENPDLKQRIEALLARCNFASNGVFVVDNSRRSAHGNAYFTGLGNNKRIVFFDTLLEQLQPVEIEAVLAHELGHFRLKHIRKRFMVSLVTTLTGFALLGLLYKWPTFYTALGVTQPSEHAALLLFLFVLPSFTFFLTPLEAWWSRLHEFQADEFAAKFADPRELALALVKQYRDNATTLTPDPLHSAFYDSHPPATIRIARLHELAAVPR
jgi:STE24 endopeptidase